MIFYINKSSCFIDAQIIVDLFINYDCSMRSANIFERLVIVLTRAAQGRQAEELGKFRFTFHRQIIHIDFLF